MKHNKLIGVLTLLVTLFIAKGYSQPNSETIAIFEPYMNESKAKEGLAKVDSFLAFNPTNVDALVLRGNFIFLIDKANSGGIELPAAISEDIYDVQDNVLTALPFTLSDSATQAIVSTWQKAIQIEPQREDVWFGIAQILALNLNQAALLEFIPKLFNQLPYDYSTAYDFANYAGIFIDHKQFDAAIKIYKAINQLFNGHAGILNSIAVEFYNVGNLDSAIAYSEKALALNQPDDLAYSNAFFFYAITQQPEKALQQLELRDKLNHQKTALTYQALLQFYQGEKQFKTARKALKVKNRATEADSVLKVLAIKRVHLTDSIYQIFHKAQLSDAHKLLIYEAFSKFYPTVDAQFNRAEILTYHKNYTAACTAFEEIDTLKCGEQQLDDYYFYYAWALYQSNQIEEAHNMWLHLINSKNFYFRSAAVYFLGKYYLRLGNKTAAKSFFESVAEFSSESKYAALCLIELNQL